MRNRSRALGLALILTLSTTAVGAYSMMELEKSVESMNLEIKEHQERIKSHRNEIKEYKELVTELEIKLDSQVKILNDLVEEEINLEEAVKKIILEDGKSKPTEEYATKLSKLIIGINKEYAKEYGFDVDIPKMMSIIRVESEFDTTVTSYVGAKGLMQLMDGTGRPLSKQLGYKEYKPYDPEQNIRIAWYYYNINKDKLGADKAIVAYNQGYRNLTKAVKVSRGNPKSYLRKIENHYSKYLDQINEPGNQ